MIRVLVLMTLTSVLAARADVCSTSRYDVIARGMTIGEVTTVRRREVHDGATLVRCDVVARINVNLLVYKYSLASHETTLGDSKGVVEYALDKTENGVHRSAKGSRHDGIFHIDATEGDHSRHVVIPLDSYDYATVDGPERLLTKPGESRTFRVFAVDELSVVNRTYTLLPEETVEVGGKRVPCRVVQYEDPNKSGKRWFIIDDLGLCILHQDGKDSDGAYTLRMKSHEVSAHAPSP